MFAIAAKKTVHLLLQVRNSVVGDRAVTLFIAPPSIEVGAVSPHSWIQASKFKLICKTKCGVPLPQLPALQLCALQLPALQLPATACLICNRT